MADGAPDVVVFDYYSSAPTQLLNQHGTRIALTSTSHSLKAGQSVNFRTALSGSVPGFGKPAGTVVFKDGSKTIATAHLANGQAAFACTPALAAAGFRYRVRIVDAEYGRPVLALANINSESGSRCVAHSANLLASESYKGRVDSRATVLGVSCRLP